MNIQNYSKSELDNATDSQLSFYLAVNLANASEVALQFPFELLRNKRKGCDRNRNIERHQLFAAFQCITTALETLLKSIIANIDYRLLASNAKSVSREEIINGDFHSINFDKCIKIIETNVAVNTSIPSKEMLKATRLLRNRIMHYYSNANESDYLFNIACGFGAYVKIYREFVMNELCDSYDRTEGFEEELSNFEDFANLIIKESGDLYEYPHYIKPYNRECRNCYSWSVIIHGGSSKCLLCGYEEINEQT